MLGQKQRYDLDMMELGRDLGVVGRGAGQTSNREEVCRKEAMAVGVEFEFEFAGVATGFAVVEGSCAVGESTLDLRIVLR
jgi:hypothetical protein